MSKRVPGSMRTRQSLCDLIEGRLSSPAGRAERRQLVWDAATKGLVLRIEPSGAKSWYFHYRLHNRSRWYRIGAVNEVGLSDARKAVRELNAQRVLDPAYDPQAEKVANRMQGTVADLVERYVADYLSDLKSGHQGTYLLQQFVVPAIGKLPITGVSRSDIRTLLNGVASPKRRQFLLVGRSYHSLLLASMRHDYFRWLVRG